MQRGKNLMPRSVAYIIGYIILIPTAVWHGFVGMLLWRWFGTPDFPISVKMATGISLMVSLFYPKPISDREALGVQRSGTLILMDTMFHRGIVPAIILGVGWLVLKGVR
jgi:hypothetical protein